MVFRNLLDITIETTILILVIAVIRKVLKKKISPNIMYFLWIFVALSTVIPYRFEWKIEVPYKVPKVVTAVPVNLEIPIEELFSDVALAEPAQNIAQSIPEQEVMTEQSGMMIPDDTEITKDTTVAGGKRGITVKRILYSVWGVGAVLFAGYVIAVNLLLFLHVYKKRQITGIKMGKVDVYFLNGYNCLLGLLRPAIYVDGDGLQEHMQQNVIRHEYQHYRVKDNMWQLVRTMCLILQWHNPCMWWAYFASKQDCELACDANATKELTREEKYQYANCLLLLQEQKKKPAENVLMVTSMGTTKKKLEERIRLIMGKKQTKRVLLTVAVICVVGLIGVIGIRVEAQSEKLSERAENTGISESSTDGMSEQELTSTEEIKVSINIEDFYTTNIGDPSNLYYVDENKVLWGSGRNNCGQLGQGTQDFDYYEELVKIAENVIHVDYSQWGFMIYLTKDHKLYGVGTDGGGALLRNKEVGFKTLADDEHYVESTPVLLMENVVFAKCGRNDIACILEDKSVWIWGTVWQDSPTNFYYVAEPEKILDNVVLIAGGMYNYAALQEDGSVWTWGCNYAGNCGTDEDILISKPIKVAEDAVMVWAGRTNVNIDCTDITEFNGVYERQKENTIILKKDGTYWACGLGIGEKKVLRRYWEVNGYEVVCTSEFVEITSEENLQ